MPLLIDNDKTGARGTRFTRPRAGAAILSIEPPAMAGG